MFSPVPQVLCPHCGNTGAGAAAPYCCSGCRAAHRFLTEAGLGRYYALRTVPGVPAETAAEAAAAPRPWLLPLLLQARASSRDGTMRLRLDVQGIQCAACVWLLERLFQRLPGALQIQVNPGIGRLDLTCRDGLFPIEEYLAEISRFGYRTGPARKAADAALDGLLLRFGVCALIAMNSMIFSASFYFGLSPAEDRTLFALFSWLNWLLGIAAIAVGGTVFFRGAVLALRRGILHLDVPIALGILLAFCGSTWSFFASDGRAAYFDTLNIFITLMLLGRLLQRRVVSQNRLLLLSDEGADGLQVRILDAAGRLKVTPAPRVRQGDVLLLLPGEVAPVRARLADGEAGAAFSTESITGEPTPRALGPGETVPAGAHNGGRRAVRVVALEGFDASALRQLLSAPTPTDDGTGGAPFWDRLSRAYVAVVLLLGAAALVGWWGAGPARALEVAVAVLVVTCPCAIGLATPLAYELAQAALRRAGVFVRHPSFLDRVLRVRKVLFDKTGTLTLGEMTLANPAALRAVDRETLRALYHMASRSNHPKSRALLGALEQRLQPSEIPPYDARLQIHEETGKGVSLDDGQRRWRLGSRAFALGAERAAGPAPRADEDVVLSQDGVPRLCFRFQEELRRGAQEEVAGLVRAGLTVYLLSGDRPERVQALARRLGLPAEAALGGLSPEEKEALVRQLDGGRRDTLMVGDGLNDTLAFLQAHCAGTPVVERPALPARADFYFLGGGLGPLSEVLRVARRTRRAVVRSLLLAGAYNVLAVALALAGLMSPLLAALAMPASSILIVLSTAWSFRRKVARPLQPPIAVPTEAIA